MFTRFVTLVSAVAWVLLSGPIPARGQVPSPANGVLDQAVDTLDPDPAPPTPPPDNDSKPVFYNVIVTGGSTNYACCASGDMITGGGGTCPPGTSTIDGSVPAGPGVSDLNQTCPAGGPANFGWEVTCKDSGGTGSVFPNHVVAMCVHQP